MADIFGNNKGNTINGTNQNDRIYGFAGKDSLNGGAGNDELYGGADNDTLDGGTGADIMFGGAGDDRYYIDDIGDVVSEQSIAGIDDGGVDRVFSTISYTLGTFLEHATLTGTFSGNLTGNTQANTLTGNTGANTLDGGGGDDNLLAGDGNDRLIGGAGRDNLTGGNGSDTFVFGPANATSTDKVLDFTANDFIGINAGDYGLLLGAGLIIDGSGSFTLDPSYFAVISGSSNVQGTVLGHGQFLYNTTSRALMWDADGAGSGFSGIALATFNFGAVLSAGSFAVTAGPQVGAISVSDVTIVEGDAGTSTVTFTVSRTGTAAFSVDFATANGTASAGDDYIATSGTLNFADGQTSQTVTITINGDVNFEPNETFFLNLTNASIGGVILDGQGLATITNNDAAPQVGNITVSDVTLAEGDAGTQTITFIISRTGTLPFTVDFATANGTASAGEDYIAGAGTLTFADGQASQTVTITINADVNFEANETFFLNLTNASNGGTILDGQAIATITNNDAVPLIGDIVVNDVTILEGDSGTKTVTFTVSRTGTAAFTVDFATANGTASAGIDYLSTAGTLSFAAGQASQTVTVTINSEASFEPNETFLLNLSNPSSGAAILDGQGLATIANDDASRIIADNLGTTGNEDVTGTAAANRLFAFAGNDRLYALAGDDLLFGGDGNDLLDGGAGTDNMFGGAGDDLYRVDGFGDLVSEESVQGVDDGGIDSVESSISYTLGNLLEKLSLTGVGAVNAAGNSLANIIKGNEAANVISGLLGADDLRGNGGDDILVGGAGKDTLTGGAGADTFLLGPADITSTDKVIDFATGVDRIRIYGADYGLSEGLGLTAGMLDPSYFVQVSGTQNQGTVFGHGQFLYNTTTSALLWDADGAGTLAAGVALATFNPVDAIAVNLTADSLTVETNVPTVSVSNPSAVPGTEGYQAYFEITLSAPASQDVYVHYSTLGGTATQGNDFVGTFYNVAIIRAGTVSTSVGVGLLLDSVAESVPETFSLELYSATLADGTNLGLGSNFANGSITDQTAHVVNIIDTRALGSVDPSGLAYVPGIGLFLSDSEVEETPFTRPNNLFLLQTDGTLPAQFSLLNFTNEPTGLTYDSIHNWLYISDDDNFSVYWVDPANPTVKLGGFTTPSAAGDPEDIAFDPDTGNLFIVNGLSHSIVEVNSSGAQVGATIVLPSTITDPEALAYDAQHDVFYVGGGFSSNIWRVDRSGNILEVISVLGGFANPVSGTSVHIKDMVFAPTSDPNDDPSLQSLYVADYGNTHLTAALSDDGRIFEVFINGAPLAPEFLV